MTDALFSRPRLYSGQRSCHWTQGSAILNVPEGDGFLRVI
jgi:hypothetical protein